MALGSRLGYGSIFSGPPGILAIAYVGRTGTKWNKAYINYNCFAYT